MDTAPDWLPALSVNADDALELFAVGHGSVQRNKRLSRAGHFLIHVSRGSLAASRAQQASEVAGKIIGMVYFSSSTPMELEGRRVYCWQAEQAWRFQAAFPWKGAPGTFRLALKTVEAALSQAERARLLSRLAAHRTR